MIETRPAGATTATPIKRYAIYFVPGPQTDLYRFGAAALGYDCYNAIDIPMLVFENFRFHMTLTGPLAPDRQALFLAGLQKCFMLSCGDRPVSVDRIAVLRQDGPEARFTVLCDFPSLCDFPIGSAS